MKRYRVMKTTMGRKYLVRMSEQEVIDQRIYYAVLVILPFVTSVVMFWLWIKMG